MDAEIVSAKDAKDGALIPAACPLCEEKRFAFIPETGHLICWNCCTGFLPHEFIALTKKLRTEH